MKYKYLLYYFFIFIIFMNFNVVLSFSIKDYMFSSFYLKSNLININNKKIVFHKKNNNFYIVQSKDTIYSIAKRYGFNYHDILKKNHINKPYTIVIGQKIWFPSSILKNILTFHNKSEKIFIPWIWPMHGTIVKYFSNLKYGGNNGIDILTLKNQPVFASNSGEVVYIDNFINNYGKIIILQHKNNYFSIYSSFNSFLIKIKDKVKKNQKIAMIKSSKKNPILFHFEIRNKEIPVNPLHYLSKNK
ncbi:peptidoglycan DD-metalloendopeptidase family protein [Buchnera aphidicola]|uniref:peptidoglycan DD-metalloendopeptidase family protein n=1 Tax=Buchnera aphidicola TaxID=9 RepID=UPI003BEF4537